MLSARKLRRQLSDDYAVPLFSQAEDGIRAYKVTGVQTCALPICAPRIPDATEYLARRHVGCRAAAALVGVGGGRSKRACDLLFDRSPGPRDGDLQRERHSSEIGRASCRERV